MQFPSISCIQIPKDFDLIAAENDLFMNPKNSKSLQRKMFLSKHLTKYLQNGIDISKNKTAFEDIAEYFAENPDDIKYLNMFTKIKSAKLIYFLYKQKTVNSEYIIDIINVIDEIQDYEHLFSFLSYFIDFIPEISKFSASLSPNYSDEFNRFMALSVEERNYLRDNEVCPNTMRFYIKNDDVEMIRSKYNSENAFENDVKPFALFEPCFSSPLAYAAYYKAKKCCLFFLNRSPVIISDSEALYNCVSSGDMNIINLFENAGAHLEKYIDAAVDSYNNKVFDYIMNKITENKSITKDEVFSILKQALNKTRNALFLVYCSEVGVDLSDVSAFSEFIPFIYSITKKVSAPSIKGPIYLNVLQLIAESYEKNNEVMDWNELLCRCSQVDSIFLLLGKGAKPDEQFTKTILPLFDPSEKQWIAFKLLFL